jgi:hypothetical protein
MQASWKRGRRGTLLTAAVALGVWAFLIYWQGDISLAGLAQALSAIVSLQFERIPPPFGSLFIDLAILVFGGLLWMLFFGQFVLPLQRAEERLQVVAEMGRGLLGKRPAAVFVGSDRRSASRVQAADEAAPRLLLLDSASAAVLRNESAYTRAVGPGLSFLEAGERLAGRLDLRIQRRQLGPQPGEDAFAAQGEGESAAAFATRQARQRETSGLTRDGAEIAPRLEVELRIESGQEQAADSKAFGFHADFAWRAMAHSGVTAQAPSDARGRQASWDWLPAHLAADLWREYLRKFKLMELFETRDFEGQAHTGLEVIGRMMKRRLQDAIVAEMDENGQLGQRQVSSPEYQLLRSRGLRVVDLRLRELQLRDDASEAELLEQWRQSWQVRGQQAKGQHAQKSQEKSALGKQAAAKDFARQLSARLYRRLMETDGAAAAPPNEAETLRILFDASLEGASGLPGLDPGIGQDLKQMRAWLEGERDGEG